MAERNGRALRVLVCDAPGARLDEVSRAVESLGHHVIAREASLLDIPAMTLAERPDVAVVIVRDESKTALSAIEDIVHSSACPVVAFLDVEDRSFVNEAAKRGIFAHIPTGATDEIQSSFDIVLRRFAEYRDLQGAFDRRAITEQAKGILMERHDIDEQAAFTMLRDAARTSNRKITEVAKAIASSRAMLPARKGHRSEDGTG